MKNRRKSLPVGFVVLLLCLAPVISNAQCSSFAKNVAKPKLEDFVHDGNYNATMLGAGDTAELYKTFFAGQKYRIVISKIENLPSVHFRLVDKDSNVLFDNQEHDFTDVWDFSVESTQMLILKLKILGGYDDQTNITKGCVAVLFGIEKEKKKK